MANSISSIGLCAAIVLTALPGVAAGEPTIDAVTKVGERRVDEGAAAQQQIERLSDQAGDLEAEYKQVNKVIDGLKVYNDLLQKQIDSQVAEIAALTDSIAKVALI